MSNETHFFILYDGIENSVFESQVLKPLIDRKQTDQLRRIILVSFEKNISVARSIKNKIPDLIECIMLKKFPFIGTFSLWYAIQQLRYILSKESRYTLTARGPLAGYISLNSITSECSAVIIQARGLLAAEYEYIHRDASWYIQKPWHRYKTHHYKKVEHAAYSTQNLFTTIEAVSKALQEYLIEHYDTQPNRITIAHSDIPTPIARETIQHWRTEVRTQLHITDDQTVYCYNGSVHAWQCPELVVLYFQELWYKNNQSFLLILTQDTAPFTKLLHKADIPLENYAVLSVKHDAIYRYLAACNVGIILREKHIINWISRPTKVLEYQAAGLTIAHNNTIAMLVEL